LKLGHTAFHRPRWLWIFGVTALVLLAVAVFGAVLILEDRFGPIDPTDPGWKVKVVNDLRIPIHVKNSAEDLEVAPGDSDIFVPPGPGQLHVIYTVTDSKGKTLGCLAVELDKTKTVEVNASQIKPCS
jgi:hypothetical protein